ncbi:hypothetical protein GCM10029964_029140 [Kibdelosporangium lantanae]
MRNDHVTLRSTAVFDLLAPRTPAVPVKVELRYDTRDPYAVVAAFRTGRAGWVEWVFARDLLADGLIAEAGDGDVRIRPAVDDPEVVVIELSSPPATRSSKPRPKNWPTSSTEPTTWWSPETSTCGSTWTRHSPTSSPTT